MPPGRCQRGSAPLGWGSGAAGLRAKRWAWCWRRRLRRPALQSAVTEKERRRSAHREPTRLGPHLEKGRCSARSESSVGRNRPASFGISAGAPRTRGASPHLDERCFSPPGQQRGASRRLLAARALSHGDSAPVASAPLSRGTCALPRWQRPGLAVASPLLAQASVFLARVLRFSQSPRPQTQFPPLLSSPSLSDTSVLSLSVC